MIVRQNQNALCCRSTAVHQNTTFAGKGSQLWVHGNNSNSCRTARALAMCARSKVMAAAMSRSVTGARHGGCAVKDLAGFSVRAAQEHNGCQNSVCVLLRDGSEPFEGLRDKDYIRRWRFWQVRPHLNQTEPESDRTVPPMSSETICFARARNESRNTRQSRGHSNR